MSNKGSWGLLRTAVTFFAGFLTCLFLLVPGKNGPTMLVNGDHAQQIADLDQAGDKIEKWSDTALIYAYRAKEYLHRKVTEEQ